MLNSIVKRRRPLGSDLSRFQDDMNDLVGRFFGDWDRVDGGMLAPLDIAEDETGFTLKIDLPGVAAGDIDIQVHDNRLTLSGQRAESNEESGENYYHVERRSGSFRREVMLPSAVDEDNIEATHTDGVLTVRLPKSERAKPRKIEVK
jgi:HSP20 family protein